MLTPEDPVIDGGKSRYTDSVGQATRCQDHGVHFLDPGVSGGVWELAEGFSLLIGGPPKASSRVELVFRALAYERFDSRMQKRFAHQVTAALPNEFGGMRFGRDKQGRRWCRDTRLTWKSAACDEGRPWIPV